MKLAKLLCGFKIDNFFGRLLKKKFALFVCSARKIDASVCKMDTKTRKFCRSPTHYGMVDELSSYLDMKCNFTVCILSSWESPQKLVWALN